MDAEPNFPHDTLFAGTTNAFGQPAQQQQQQQQQPQTNIFGQPQQQPQENKPASTGFGAFGGTNAFGQPAQQQTPQTNGMSILTTSAACSHTSTQI
jgi:nucleoporin p58/p45